MLCIFPHPNSPNNTRSQNSPRTPQANILATSESAQDITMRGVQEDDTSPIQPRPPQSDASIRGSYNEGNTPIQFRIYPSDALIQDLYKDNVAPMLSDSDSDSDEDADRNKSTVLPMEYVWDTEVASNLGNSCVDAEEQEMMEEAMALVVPGYKVPITGRISGARVGLCY